MNLNTAVGAYLSSQTGFTSQAAIQFNFQSAGQLCGTDAYPPNAFRVVGE